MASNTYLKQGSDSFTGVKVTTQDGSSTEQRYPYTWNYSLSGVKLKDWRGRIKRGDDASTNMQATETEVAHSDAYLAMKARRNFDGQIQERSEVGFVNSAADPPSGNPASLDSSEAYRQASKSFYRACKNAQRSVDSGVVIGELKKTIDMVKGRGKQMLGLFPTWRNRFKRRRRRGETPQKRAADAQLEFQMGWTPLASDIGGMMEAFHWPRRDTKTVHGFGTTRSQTGSSLSKTAVGVLTYDKRFVSSASVEVHMSGAVSVKTKGIEGKMQALGLYPENFVPTLYELLPWSFLIDYFTGLGSTIDALCFPSRDIAWANTTVVKMLENNYTSGNVSLGSLSSSWKELAKVDVPQSTRWRKKQVIRTIGVPRIPWPALQLPAHPGQWAALGALAVQRIYRPFRYIV